MIAVSAIQDNLQSILSRITSAALSAGRPSAEIKLVAATKGQSVQSVQEYIDCCKRLGIPAMIGESYIQEFRDKFPLLRGAYEAHFIGGLQTNKVKAAVEMSAVIQSVDSEKIIDKINSEAVKLRKLQRVMFQINISDDQAKKGFTQNTFRDFLKGLKGRFPNVVPVGLMTITALYDDVEETRRDFKALHDFRLSILNSPERSVFLDGKIDLSMGMSSDFEIAIEEGSTMVRVGTAIFGERSG